MAAPRGHRPPNAGRGRVKGSINRVHRDVKAVIAEAINTTAPDVLPLWRRLARSDPRAALDVWAKLAEYVMPRLSRSEVQAAITAKREPPSLADLYQSIEFVEVDSTRVGCDAPSVIDAQPVDDSSCGGSS